MEILDKIEADIEKWENKTINTKKSYKEYNDYAYDSEEVLDYMGVEEDDE